ncbi:MAG: hypothetical protein QGG40_14285 [Myxococcota bacterium]|nr:hypothetical protein [Myxococcota bacterium]
MRATLFLLFTGCVVTETELDTRPLCIGDPGGITQVEIIEDEPITAGFASSNCGVVTEAWCELETDGDMLYASTFHEREHPRFSESCLLIDKGIDVTCETESLPAGTYTLVYADTHEEIEVSSTVDPFCLRPE